MNHLIVQIIMLYSKSNVVLLLSAILCVSVINNSYAQTVLQANGQNQTYELINSVLAPNGGNAVESPDCAHPEFGRHIRESWDTFLNKFVFDFHIHVTPDNDRCITFDRQRLEIKTFESSPDFLKVVEGETVEYIWKFKLPTGFSVSASFTHLHQVKPVDGDDSTPIFALTARRANPNRMELNYYPTTAIGMRRLASAHLSLFENRWVEVRERIRANVVGGSYSIVITNLETGATILSFQNPNISTLRSDNRFFRPKWGIYRSLNQAQDLRDEVVQFADFSIQELNTTEVPSISENKRSIVLFPNPAHLETTLTYYSENSEKKKIRVTDLSGREKISKYVFFNQGTHQYSLDLHSLEAGVYLVNVVPGKSVERLMLLE